MKKTLAAAALLAAAAAAQAVPFAITAEGAISNSEFPDIANETYSVTFIFASGGNTTDTSTASRVWDWDYLTCTIWRMNTARDVVYQQDLAATPPTSGQGSFVTDASGALTMVPTRVEVDSPAAQPGQYAAQGSIQGAVKWFASNGGAGVVFIDRVGSASPRTFSTGSGLMQPSRWSAPVRVAGPCDPTPYAAPPAATPVPTLGHAGLALLAGLLGALGWRTRRRGA
ncbi:MAG: IPTL-CTERM sorting domain-containing protein [Ottowia sp.]|uniref:IPTL-CTERM sorting domain-containing protein n=1 Tax=Ottowia sp. TaxID=1898956 RepID=UPI0039E4BF65